MIFLDKYAQRELNVIKGELQSVINELIDISYEVKKDFKGINSERCVETIINVAEQYKDAKNKLNDISASESVQ